MTIVLRDARHGITHNIDEQPYVVTSDIVYADDTMLIASDPADVQCHLDRVVAAGAGYGLQLNLDKTVLLRIRGDADIFGSDGSPLKVEDEAVYLGGLLSVDGRPVRELTRRLGEARQTFDKLASVWRHANLARQHKQRIFDACVIPKLLYGLETTWLLQADRQKLDGFYARCLRKLLGVAPSFVSRVSNQSVLCRFGVQPLSQQLLGRQLLYYGRLAAQSDDSLPRSIALEPSSIEPRSWNTRRRVGRPCLRWAACVYAHALRVAGGCQTNLKLLLESPQQVEWRSAVLQSLQ